MPVVTTYLSLLRTLFVPDERPRVLPHLRDTVLRRNRPLPPPIVCLVSERAATGELLSRTSAWLEASRRRAAPRMYVDIAEIAPGTGDSGADDVVAECKGVLDRLRIGLARDNTGMGRIRFRRYRTVAWLVDQDFGDGHDVRADLKQRLPDLIRGPGQPVSDQVPADDAGIPLIKRVLNLVLLLQWAVRQWISLSWRISWLSSNNRWFMNQRYLSPELSDSFLGFASRLVQPNRRYEDPEQVAKLLVHAFLEDLRRTYRRRLWRPSSWRRTAYPVVLLDRSGPGTPGAAVMRRLSDIRNEAGMFDPLLVVATMARPLDDREPGELEHVGTGKLEGAQADPLAQWRDTIGEDRRRRVPGAWYLRLRLPDRLATLDRELRPTPDPRPPKPPPGGRKWVVATVTLALLAAVVVPTTLWTVSDRARHCGRGWWKSDRAAAVVRAGGECVGYSTDGSFLFGDDETLTTLQRQVFEQNRKVERNHRDNPRRPVVSVVYFAGLTYSDTNVRYPRAQAEELAGLAMRQHEMNRMQSTSEPLLRVIVANGGSNMARAGWVTDNLLRDLVHTDPSIVGVVGLDRSSTDTRGAIARLGEWGVPVLPTMLSGEGLSEASPLYLQPVPSNRSQARLVADYVAGARYSSTEDRAGQSRYDSLVLYYPVDRDDLYVNSLVDALRAELTRRRIPFREQSWTEQQELNRVPAPCSGGAANPREVHFFAGRNHDFVSFLKAMTVGCGGAALPTIVADDAATRVIADPHGLDVVPIGLPVRYVTKGAPVVLGGRDCVDGVGRLGNRPTGPGFSNFCNLLAELVSRTGGGYRPVWPADRTGLAFEVAGLFLDAVRQNGGRFHHPDGAEAVPNRAAIAMELRERDYPGVTGRLRFGGERVAEDATLGILRTGNVRDQKEAQRCVLLIGDMVDSGADRGADGCPVGTRVEDEAWAPPR
ncbi:hypothetical protein [Nocardia mexicana]|uniref:ABC-type branched-subunit amino acid transport system substrate-binding protein n=1 Tax=Nocardia mexicana TaxID=279262 RepID=A0A370HCG7_9NOCA|nr:hypothetical protein [Nocardia mexicana]RDI54181.1 hypothetical protein DFR68_102305 [Nocardia mexicana]